MGISKRKRGGRDQGLDELGCPDGGITTTVDGNCHSEAEKVLRFDGRRQSQCTLGMLVLMGPTADAQHL